MREKCIVQHIGTMEIKEGAVVADPCYGNLDIVRLGARLGKESIRTGIYDCYIGWVEKSMWGRKMASVAFMEIVLDGERFMLSSDVKLGECGVDSGTLMIADAGEWDTHHGNSDADEDWYGHNVVNGPERQAYTMDGGFSFLSGTGSGDGFFDAFADTDEGGMVKSITAYFSYPEGDEDGYDFLDFIEAEDEPDFKAYE